MCVCVRVCAMHMYVCVCVYVCVRLCVCAFVCMRAQRRRCTVQHTATHSNTRQHKATHDNTRQHTATHCTIRIHTVHKDAVQNFCRRPHIYTCTHICVYTYMYIYILVYTWFARRRRALPRRAPTGSDQSHEDGAKRGVSWRESWGKEGRLPPSQFCLFNFVCRGLI